ncbi:unnamed protein product, partial [Amoebophrya sp. A25]
GGDGGVVGTTTTITAASNGEQEAVDMKIEVMEASVSSNVVAASAGASHPSGQLLLPGEEQRQLLRKGQPVESVPSVPVQQDAFIAQSLVAPQQPQMP